MSQPTPKIRWMRDEAGNLIFFKHNHDLSSDELAADDDEIIVLKAKVQIKTPSIVAIPILRELINEPGGDDETLGRLNDEAIYAAQTREREVDPPYWRIHYPKGEPFRSIDVGPADGSSVPSDRFTDS